MTSAVNCDPGVAGEIAAVRRRSLASFLSLAARIVLEAEADLIGSLGHGLGQQKLAAFLGGTDSTFVRAHELSVLPHYGVFEFARRQWIDRLTDILREAGYLHVGGSFRPVLELSREAEELTRNPEAVPLLPQQVLDDPILGPSCPRSPLEEKLRVLRARLARTARRTPRQVLSDLLVRHLCCERPRTRDELESRLPEPVKDHVEAIWEVLSENQAPEPSPGTPS